MEERPSDDVVLHSRRIYLSLFVTVLLTLMGWWGSGRAIGTLAYKNPEDAVLGINGSSRVLLFDAPEKRPPGARWIVEAGERRLFDIKGLDYYGVRLGLREQRWGVIVSVARVSAPIGGESLLSVESLFLGNRYISFSVGVNLNWLSLDGMSSEYFVSASARMFARVRSGFVIGYTAEAIRIAGEALAGGDANLYLVVLADSPVCVLSRLGVARDGVVDVGLSTRLRISRHLWAAVGYDDATGILKSSITIPLMSIGVSVGASIHPVLGVSKSLFVSWGWDS
ncbi:MAG: hypothetical protein JSW58_02350 [Candidatus Latescibacterota bacterium]|nr:MAG: hypothetical protein JSW58_02350 [Candidatus Latescibacterota bacterium]